MDCTAILAFLALAVLVQALLWIASSKKKQGKLPPGPLGFPLLGSFHLLGKLPHRDLQKLSKKYGSIMSMKLGLVQTIVVSSPEAAEVFLRTQDQNFSSRPPHQAVKHISYNQKNLSFAPYGSYWRDMRKMCTLELLSSAKIASFRSMRKEELALLVDYIKGAARRSEAVDISNKVTALGVDMSCRMIFGKKYLSEEFGDAGFKTVIEEAMLLGALPNIGDYIPQLARFDLQGLTKRMKAVFKVFDAFFEKIIDEHIQNKDQNKVKDFADIMLAFVGSQESEYRIDRDNIKAIMLDMLVASMDTSATTTEWVISEIISHPKVMKKLQKELEEKVGMDRMVEETDLEGLEYLDMVIKETFRLHPVAPLLLPHLAMESTTVQGFFIPKDTRVIVNSWAIGRDPNVWNDPEEFVPERFLGSNIDVRGRDFRLIPFGAGRRICPGTQLAMTLVRLMVAQLVHCFDWTLPNGMLPSELDMSEVFGIVTPRAQRLLAIPAYRLNL